MGKGDDRETRGAAIWKQTSKKLETAGDIWRDSIKTEMPGGILLAAYGPQGTTKSLIDWLIDWLRHGRNEISTDSQPTMLHGANANTSK